MERDWLTGIISDLEAHHASKGDSEQRERLKLLRRFAAFFKPKS
jgi:hypothetical protein